jgi:hypothetical protein
MAAVHQYFQSGREMAARRKEWQRKLLEKPSQPATVEKVDTHEDEFLEFDTLLRRDWFEHDDDIVDLVWDASYEAFQMIMVNMPCYSSRVRSVLTNTFVMARVSQDVKISMKYLSEDDLGNIELVKLKDLGKKIEDAWRIYKKDHGLSRPENDVDDKYTELFETLQEKKRERDSQKDKIPKKYVPPSLRGKVDEPSSIDKEISKLENEILNVQRQVLLEEQRWENEKKSELYGHLLLSVS